MPYFLYILIVPMAKIDTIHSFPLEDETFLFFDIFARNNEVVLLYPEYIDVSLVVVSLNNENLSIKWIDDTGGCGHSPIHVVVYSLPETPADNQLSISVKYMDKENDFTISYFETADSNKKRLTLTTLFKDDFYLLDFFFAYYQNQGVEHFYMYYNGKLADLKEKFVLKENPAITWLEWDHQYHKEGYICYQAQISQVNHALYKYGKPYSEYMTFCDLDEYLSVRMEKLTMIDVVKIELLQEEDSDSPPLDTIGFCNSWSSSSGVLPVSAPMHFYGSSKCNGYGNRSKCIHRTKNIHCIRNVHAKEKCQVDGEHFASNTVFIMFHFHKWSNPSRLVDNALNDIQYIMDASYNVHRIVPNKT